MTDDGPREFSSATPRPTGALFDENAGKRSQVRHEEGVAALMDAWGGRDFTELEKLDQQISFWREVDGGEERLEDLETQRAKLAARGE